MRFRKHHTRFLFTLLLITLLAPSMRPLTATEAPTTDATPKQSPPPKILSPLMIEVLSILEQEELARKNIEMALEASQDQNHARELERQLESLKRQTEIQILQVQANHARLAGREEQALQIERSIELMMKPQTPRLRDPADQIGDKDLKQE